MSAGDIAARRAVEAVWRIEAAKIVGGVARVLHDVGLAEEMAQDALVAALEHWPRDGVPANPGAWLMAVAKRRALDQLRHHAMRERRHEQIGHELDAAEARFAPDTAELVAAAEADPFGDDVLRLLFVACHPVLNHDARVALTLRLVGGLATDEIARAFLVPEATVAQRIVRAKRALAAARVPFEVPAADALAPRLASVTEVIYLVFNEGYAATAGEHWTRPALCDEALRLGRMLAALAPSDSEVHGLLALMELQASRLAARTDRAGRALRLDEQDRSRWDAGAITRGRAALARAEARAAAASRPLGPYALQAAIAACHAQAPRADATDWPRIAALYEALAGVAPSPVVELNRAMAVGMAYGAEAGLAIVEALAGEAALARYPWLPAVRAELLHRLGREDEARRAFAEAAALTRNHRERELLLRRAGVDAG